MDAELKIKIDKDVIDKAKGYAFLHRISLSRMIESYLKSLIDMESSEPKDEIEISSSVKSMSTGVQMPMLLDYKKEIGDYLLEKYK
ncbi:hypothetical protein SAMN06265379_105187 [Saccharicrinis carchari]|uniref:Uncharacterized protein n=1 Tax=Saccharicrinis carchari TaxID=1168039 RepID=A0A521DIQ4_SACCC|nr:DUF6364 family protein [Saccharicrinis carchari]SMO71011.1 hypothetical protein SAMN06265379_105187 [Saccharicrinis carchari]